MTATASSLLSLLLVAGLGSAATQAHARATAPGAHPTAQKSSRADSTQSAALGTLSAINTAEISAGRLALAKAHDARTKQYAQQMIDEHTANNLKVAGWSPDVTAAPAQMKKTEGEQTLAMLQNVEGTAFDGAYLQAMVRDHRAALQALDTTLIPAARDADVAAFLRTTRAHVAQHLEKAQQLLQQIEGRGREASR